jgi:hypothetical protein
MHCDVPPENAFLHGSSPLTHPLPFSLPLKGRGRGGDAFVFGEESKDLSYVFIMCLPAARSFTGPFPPGFFAARDLAAVILPPLLFFAILNTSFK